jgi:DNA polymerase III epsilon subunit-like protein
MIDIEAAFGRPTVAPTGNVLVYDTETTGYVIYDRRSEDPSQPHLVQLGALLCGPAGEVLEFLDVIIKPDGWVIPAAAAAVHGITTEIAAAKGIPAAAAVAKFVAMSERATERAAHNENFDQRVMRTAIHRHHEPAYADIWKGMHQITCTQRATLKIANLPPTPKMIEAGMTKWSKTPQARESYLALFGEEPAGQHTALGDAIAVRRILFRLRGIDVEPFRPAGSEAA